MATFIKINIYPLINQYSLQGIYVLDILEKVCVVGINFTVVFFPERNEGALGVYSCHFKMLFKE